MPPSTAHHGRLGSPESRVNVRKSDELAGGLFLRKGGLAVVIICLAIPRVILAQEEEPTDGAGLHSLYYGAHLPEDRALARKLTRAEELLSRQRFSEALPILDELLAAEQDVFIVFDSSSNESPLSVKARARQLLAALPVEGHEAYALLFEAEATRQVKQAIKESDRGGLSRAAARYGITRAGQEAMLILSQLAADRGEFDEAARLIDRLYEMPIARQRWGDYLLLRAAELAMRLGDLVTAEARIAESQLRGKAAADLRRILSASPAIHRPQPEDRNPVSPPGTPHLWERWQSRVIVDRRIEAQLNGRRDRQLDSLLTTPLLPSAIAIGDLVVARSLNNLVAIDWNTGKRIWETREESEGWSDTEGDAYVAYRELNYGHGRVHPLFLRLWKDAVYSSLSSDGRRVFAIRDLDYARASYSSRWGMLPGFSDGADRNSKLTNRLAAYEIAAEGKLAWEINGAETNHTLSGAFFLGAPLAVSTSLFAMAEIDSTIYLLELSGEDGGLLWKQSLVSLERGIDQDLGRRLAGAVLSARDGVLICPTGAGVVMAVNAFDRTLMWTYRIPVHKSVIDQNEDILQRRLHSSLRSLSNQWLDATAILSAEFVVFTAPESSDLHCVRLATGEVVWTRSCEDGLYLAGLTETTAIVVGKRQIEAIGLADGNPKWSTSFPEGRTAQGRGLISGEAFWLPLDEGNLCILSLKDGKRLQLLKTQAGQPVGNLISHRGSVLSQSLAIIDRFDRREELQREIEKRLADNASDAVAFRLAGELAQTAGNTEESLLLFKRSYAADEGNPLARERVIGALLTALKRDFSKHRQDLPLLESLVVDPHLRLQVLQLKADGLATAGEIREAFQCCSQLYEESEGREYTMLETNFGATRIDAWFRGALTRLWQASDAETQAWISQTVADLRSSLTASSPLVSVERFGNYFGVLPGQEPVLLDLADRYHSAGKRREAELIRLQLLTRGDPRITSEARDLLHTSRASEELNAVVEIDPPKRVRLGWPFVQIVADAERKRRSRRSNNFRPDEEQISYAAIRFDSTLMGEIGPATIAWANGGNEIVVWDDNGDVVNRSDVGLMGERVRFNPRNDGSCQGRMGCFAYLSLDGRTVGLDLHPQNTRDSIRMWLQGGEWKPIRIAPGRSDRRRLSLDKAYLMLVTPVGIVLHSKGTLYCVHPISGDILWLRSDLITSPVVCGDAERLYVYSRNAKIGQVLAMSDGSELGAWQVPRGLHIASSGCRILTQQETESGVVYRVVDLSRSRTEIELSMETGAKTVAVEPGVFAIVDPTGRLEVVDIGAGEVTLSKSLRAEPRMVSLQAMRSGSRLYLMINTLSDADQRLAGYTSPPGETAVTGRMYAIDMEAKDFLWPRPVQLTGRVALPLQPRASPALLLASFRSSSDSDTREGLVELLAIDIATGQSIFRSEPLAQSLQDSIVIHVDRRPEWSLQIESRLWEVRLFSTDIPRSPEPVAHDDVELAGSRGKGGLWGVGKQLGRVLEGAFGGRAE